MRKGERPMRNHLLCAGLVLAGALLLGSGLRADDKKKAEPSLEDYAKMSQPGPEHKKLDPLAGSWTRSEEHTSELQSHHDLVCRLLLEKKKKLTSYTYSYHDHMARILALIKPWQRNLALM